MPEKKTIRKKVAAKRTTKEKVVKVAPVVAEKVTPKHDVRRSYLYAVGRRKTSVARVRLYAKGEGVILVNGKKHSEYFPEEFYAWVVRQPIDQAAASFGEITVRVTGGGVRSQAEAIRHGIARVLVLREPEVRKTLKQVGFLTRDPRVKERKKYGLKRARRAPQWQKR